MAHVLVVYATVEGQTRKIAERIGAYAREAGHKPLLMDAASRGAKGMLLPHPDAVFVAASVHFGKHAPAAAEFVRRHRELLESVPSAFLSVSLSAAQGDDEKHRADAASYLAGFLGETGWHPALSATVAGALAYTRYGFFRKLMVKVIARRGGLPTDASRDHEFTDWEALRQSVAEVLQRVDTDRPWSAGTPRTP